VVAAVAPAAPGRVRACSPSPYPPDATVGSTSLPVETRIGGIVCKSASATVPVEVATLLDLALSGLPDTYEETPGGFLCVNDDDDDNNGVADKDDPGPTVGEDDLVPITVTADGRLDGTLTLGMLAGGSRIKLYENPDRSTPVTLPQSWPLLGLQKTFTVTYYVEGIAPSAAARDAGLSLSFAGAAGPCDDTIRLTVYSLQTANVDATNPHAVRINYHVDPHDIVLDTGMFTAPGITETRANLATDFSFTYDQGSLVTGNNTITLQTTSGGARCTRNITVTNNLTNAPDGGEMTETAVFHILLNDGGQIIPVIHDIFAAFKFICYSVNVLPVSKTLWVGESIVNISTTESSEIPTAISAWTEQFELRDTNGTQLDQVMVDFAGQTIPPQGPNFRSKKIVLDAYFSPDLNITAVGKISTLVFTDGNGNFFFPTVLSVNKEVDLPLEANAAIPTTCP